MTDTLGAIIPLVGLAVVVALIASGWKVYAKAGEPGWAILVPFYNAYVFFKIAGKPGWWLILMFVPIVNLLVSIVACIELAKRFGKSGGFAAGMIILPFVFYPILGFGDARYSAA